MYTLAWNLFLCFLAMAGSYVDSRIALKPSRLGYFLTGPLLYVFNIPGNMAMAGYSGSLTPEIALVLGFAFVMIAWVGSVACRRTPDVGL